MLKKIPFRKILPALLVIFILMQFYRIDKTNPPVVEAKDFILSENPPAPIAKILKDACYDCHSHQTNYPWYTNVMPFSYWIKGHIDHGRKKLNFSTWAAYPAKKKSHKLEECAEFVRETKMPLATYLIPHPEARISEEERERLAKWFELVRGQME